MHEALAHRVDRRAAHASLAARAVNEVEALREAIKRIELLEPEVPALTAAQLSLANQPDTLMYPLVRELAADRRARAESRRGAVSGT